MTLARVRRPTCEARPAAREASPMTYTPPWKYRTTWRGPVPSTVISAAGTPPSAAAVTVTSAGSGCADINSRSSRRCSLTPMPAGKADCRRTASRFSRCSVLTADVPSVRLGSAPRRACPCQSAAEISCRDAGNNQARRQAGEEASPDPGDSRDRSTVVFDVLAQLVRIVEREDGTVIVSPDRDLADDGQAVGVGVERFADQIVDGAGAVVLGRVDVIDSRGDRGLEHADGRCPVRWRTKGVRAGELHRAVPRPPDLHLAECEGRHHAGPQARAGAAGLAKRWH